MSIFINREPELTVIQEAVSTLVEKRRLLRTPIVEFYGVDGIGKTALLNKIAEQCDSQKLDYFWTDGSQDFFPQIVREAGKLLQGKKPVVVIMDALDTADKERFHEIETSLGDLAGNSLVFIVLASNRIERFENSRAITRKLALYHIEPFDHNSCLQYLNVVANHLSSEIHEMIFDWTRGYPLAMKVLVEVITQLGLDLTKPQDQKEIVSLLTERVIQQVILSKVQSEELSWYQTILSLLSVPRRFNLVMMQDIIEKYAPDLKLSSSLAYITFPNKINHQVNLLDWDMKQAGYRIDGSVRNLFLLKLRIEQPEDYRAMHIFLAEINQLFAQEVSGTDRIRYIHEYLYHSANGEKLTTTLPNVIEKDITQIARGSSAEDLLQLYSEIISDEELRSSWGKDFEHIKVILEKYLDQEEQGL